MVVMSAIMTTINSVFIPLIAVYLLFNVWFDNISTVVDQTNVPGDFCFETHPNDVGIRHHIAPFIHTAIAAATPNSKSFSSSVSITDYLSASTAEPATTLSDTSSLSVPPSHTQLSHSASQMVTRSDAKTITLTEVSATREITRTPLPTLLLNLTNQFDELTVYEYTIPLSWSEANSLCRETSLDSHLASVRNKAQWTFLVSNVFQNPLISSSFGLHPLVYLGGRDDSFPISVGAVDRRGIWTFDADGRFGDAPFAYVNQTDNLGKRNTTAVWGSSDPIPWCSGEPLRTLVGDLSQPQVLLANGTGGGCWRSVGQNDRQNDRSSGAQQGPPMEVRHYICVRHFCNINDDCNGNADSVSGLWPQCSPCSCKASFVGVDSGSTDCAPSFETPSMVVTQVTGKFLTGLNYSDVCSSRGIGNISNARYYPLAIQTAEDFKAIGAYNEVNWPLASKGGACMMNGRSNTPMTGPWSWVSSNEDAFPSPSAYWDSFKATPFGIPPLANLANGMAWNVGQPNNRLQGAYLSDPHYIGFRGSALDDLYFYEPVGCYMCAQYKCLPSDCDTAASLAAGVKYVNATGLFPNCSCTFLHQGVEITSIKWTTSMTFQQAQALCQKEPQRSLAVARNQAQWAQIQSLLPRNMWLGLSDVSINGRWRVIGGGSYNRFNGALVYSSNGSLPSADGFQFPFYGEWSAGQSSGHIVGENYAAIGPDGKMIATLSSNPNITGVYCAKYQCNPYDDCSGKGTVLVATKYLTTAGSCTCNCFTGYSTGNCGTFTSLTDTFVRRTVGWSADALSWNASSSACAAGEALASIRSADQWAAVVANLNYLGDCWLGGSVQAGDTQWRWFNNSKVLRFANEVFSVENTLQGNYYVPWDASTYFDISNTNMRYLRSSTTFNDMLYPVEASQTTVLPATEHLKLRCYLCVRHQCSIDADCTGLNVSYTAVDGSWPNCTCYFLDQNDLISAITWAAPMSYADATHVCQGQDKTLTIVRNSDQWPVLKADAAGKGSAWLGAVDAAGSGQWRATEGIYNRFSYAKVSVDQTILTPFGGVWSASAGSLFTTNNGTLTSRYMFLNTNLQLDWSLDDSAIVPIYTVYCTKYRCNRFDDCNGRGGVTGPATPPIDQCQCSCTVGYFGTRCEFFYNTGDVIEKHNVAWRDEPLTFSDIANNSTAYCGEGRVLATIRDFDQWLWYRSQSYYFPDDCWLGGGASAGSEEWRWLSSSNVSLRFDGQMFSNGTNVVSPFYILWNMSDYDNSTASDRYLMTKSVKNPARAYVRPAGQNDTLRCYYCAMYQCLPQDCPSRPGILYTDVTGVWPNCSCTWTDQSDQITGYAWDQPMRYEYGEEVCANRGAFVATPRNYAQWAVFRVEGFENYWLSPSTATTSNSTPPGLFKVSAGRFKGAVFSINSSVKFPFRGEWSPNHADLTSSSSTALHLSLQSQAYYDAKEAQHAYNMSVYCVRHMCNPIDDCNGRGTINTTIVFYWPGCVCICAPGYQGDQCERYIDVSNSDILTKVTIPFNETPVTVGDIIDGDLCGPSGTLATVRNRAQWDGLRGVPTGLGLNFTGDCWLGGEALPSSSEWQWINSSNSRFGGMVFSNDLSVVEPFYVPFNASDYDPSLFNSLRYLRTTSVPNSPNSYVIPAPSDLRLYCYYCVVSTCTIKDCTRSGNQSLSVTYVSVSGVWPYCSCTWVDQNDEVTGFVFNTSVSFATAKSHCEAEPNRHMAVVRNPTQAEVYEIDAITNPIWLGLTPATSEGTSRVISGRWAGALYANASDTLHPFGGLFAPQAIINSTSIVGSLVAMVDAQQYYESLEGPGGVQGVYCAKYRCNPFDDCSGRGSIVGNGPTSLNITTNETVIVKVNGTNVTKIVAITTSVIINVTKYWPDCVCKCAAGYYGPRCERITYNNDIIRRSDLPWTSLPLSYEDILAAPNTICNDSKNEVMLTVRTQGEWNWFVGPNGYLGDCWLGGVVAKGGHEWKGPDFPYGARWANVTFSNETNLVSPFYVKWNVSDYVSANDEVRYLRTKYLPRRARSYATTAGPSQRLYCAFCVTHLCSIAEDCYKTALSVSRVDGRCKCVYPTGTVSLTDTITKVESTTVSLSTSSTVAHTISPSPIHSQTPTLSRSFVDSRTRSLSSSALPTFSKSFVQSASGSISLSATTSSSLSGSATQTISLSIAHSESKSALRTGSKSAVGLPTITGSFAPPNSISPKATPSGTGSIFSSRTASQPESSTAGHSETQTPISTPSKADTETLRNAFISLTASSTPSNPISSTVSPPVSKTDTESLRTAIFSLTASSTLTSPISSTVSATGSTSIGRTTTLETPRTKTRTLPVLTTTTTAPPITIPGQTTTAAPVTAAPVPIAPTNKTLSDVGYGYRYVEFSPVPPLYGLYSGIPLLFSETYKGYFARRFMSTTVGNSVMRYSTSTSSLSEANVNTSSSATGTPGMIVAISKTAALMDWYMLGQNYIVAFVDIRNNNSRVNNFSYTSCGDLMTAIPNATSSSNTISPYSFLRFALGTVSQTPSCFTNIRFSGVAYSRTPFVEGAMKTYVLLGTSTTAPFEDLTLKSFISNVWRGSLSSLNFSVVSQATDAVFIGDLINAQFTTAPAKLQPLLFLLPYVRATSTSASLQPVRISNATHLAVGCTLPELQSYPALLVPINATMSTARTQHLQAYQLQQQQQRFFQAESMNSAFSTSSLTNFGTPTNCFLYDTIDDLHLACQQSSACIGFSTIRMRDTVSFNTPKSLPLCMYTGTSTTATIAGDVLAYPRVFYLKPKSTSIPSCTVGVEQSGIVAVYVQQTLMSSGAVVVRINSDVVARCGGTNRFVNNFLGVDGRCGQWALCYTGRVGSFANVSVTPTALLPQGGCDNSLGVIVQQTVMDSIEVPTTTEAPIVRLNTDGLVFRPIAKSIDSGAEEQIKIFVYATRFAALDVQQTGYSCSLPKSVCGATASSVISFATSASCQACGGYKGFLGSREGMSDRCDTYQFCDGFMAMSSTSPTATCGQNAQNTITPPYPSTSPIYSGLATVSVNVSALRYSMDLCTGFGGKVFAAEPTMAPGGSTVAGNVSAQMAPPLFPLLAPKSTSDLLLEYLQSSPEANEDALSSAPTSEFWNIFVNSNASFETDYQQSTAFANLIAVPSGSNIHVLAKYAGLLSPTANTSSDDVRSPFEGFFTRLFQVGPSTSRYDVYYARWSRLYNVSNETVAAHPLPTVAPPAIATETLEVTSADNETNSSTSTTQTATATTTPATTSTLTEIDPENTPQNRLYFNSTQVCVVDHTRELASQCSFYIPRGSTHIRVRAAQTDFSTKAMTVSILLDGKTVSSSDVCGGSSTIRFGTDVGQQDRCDSFLSCTNRYLYTEDSLADNNIDGLVVVTLPAQMRSYSCDYIATIIVDFSRSPDETVFTCSAFECPNGERKCVPYSNLCDGIQDCESNADEENCNGLSFLPSESICISDEYKTKYDLSVFESSPAVVTTTLASSPPSTTIAPTYAAPLPTTPAPVTTTTAIAPSVTGSTVPASYSLLQKCARLAVAAGTTIFSLEGSTCSVINASVAITIFSDPTSYLCTSIWAGGKGSATYVMGLTDPTAFKACRASIHCNGHGTVSEVSGRCLCSCDDGYFGTACEGTLRLEKITEVFIIVGWVADATTISLSALADIVKLGSTYVAVGCSGIVPDYSNEEGGEVEQNDNISTSLRLRIGCTVTSKRDRDTDAFSHYRTLLAPRSWAGLNATMASAYLPPLFEVTSRTSMNPAVTSPPACLLNSNGSGATCSLNVTHDGLRVLISSSLSVASAQVEASRSTSDEETTAASSGRSFSSASTMILSASCRQLASTSGAGGCIVSACDLSLPGLANTTVTIKDITYNSPTLLTTDCASPEVALTAQTSFGNLPTITNTTVDNVFKDYTPYLIGGVAMFVVATFMCWATAAYCYYRFRVKYTSQMKEDLPAELLAVDISKAELRTDSITATRMNVSPASEEAMLLDEQLGGQFGAYKDSDFIEVTKEGPHQHQQASASARHKKLTAKGNLDSSRSKKDSNRTNNGTGGGLHTSRSDVADGLSSTSSPTLYSDRTNQFTDRGQRNTGRRTAPLLSMVDEELAEIKDPLAQTVVGGNVVGGDERFIVEDTDVAHKEKQQLHHNAILRLRRIKAEMLVRLHLFKHIEAKGHFRNDRCASAFLVAGCVLSIAAAFMVLYYKTSFDRQSNFSVMYEEYSDRHCSLSPVGYMPRRIFTISSLLAGTELASKKCERMQSTGESVGVSFAMGYCSGSEGAYSVQFRMGTSQNSCRRTEMQTFLNGACVPIQQIDPDSARNIYVKLTCSESSLILERTTLLQQLTGQEDVFEEGEMTEISARLLPSPSTSARSPTAGATSSDPNPLTIVGVDSDRFSLDVPELVFGETNAPGTYIMYPYVTGSTIGYSSSSWAGTYETIAEYTQESAADDGYYNPLRLVLQTFNCAFEPDATAACVSDQEAIYGPALLFSTASNTMSTSGTTLDSLNHEGADDDGNSASFPRTPNAPIGTIFGGFGTSEQTTWAAAGPQAHRYYGVVGTAMDIGRHFPSDPTADPVDGEGWAISMWLRCDSTTLGFAYAVSDAFENRETFQVYPIERLATIIDSGKGGRAWFNTTYRVYHALYVNGPGKVLTFTHASPYLEGKVTEYDFDLRQIGATFLMNGQWHHVGISLLVENGKVRAQLSVDGVSSYTEAGWSNCVENLPEKVAVIPPAYTETTTSASTAPDNVTQVETTTVTNNISFPVFNHLTDRVTKGGMLVVGYFNGGVFGLKAYTKQMLDSDFLPEGTLAMVRKNQFPREATLALGTLLLTLAAILLVILITVAIRDLRANVASSSVSEYTAVSLRFYTMQKLVIESLATQAAETEVIRESLLFQHFQNFNGNQTGIVSAGSEFKAFGESDHENDGDDAPDAGLVMSPTTKFQAPSSPMQRPRTSSSSSPTRRLSSFSQGRRPRSSTNYDELPHFDGVLRQLDTSEQQQFPNDSMAAPPFQRSPSSRSQQLQQLKYLNRGDEGGRAVLGVSVEDTMAVYTNKNHSISPGSSLTNIGAQPPHLTNPQYIGGSEGFSRTNSGGIGNRFARTSSWGNRLQKEELMQDCPRQLSNVSAFSTPQTMIPNGGLISGTHPNSPRGASTSPAIVGISERPFMFASMASRPPSAVAPPVEFTTIRLWTALRWTSLNLQDFNQILTEVENQRTSHRSHAAEVVMGLILSLKLGDGRKGMRGWGDTRLGAIRGTSTAGTDGRQEGEEKEKARSGSRGLFSLFAPSSFEEHRGRGGRRKTILERLPFFSSSDTKNASSEGNAKISPPPSRESQKRQQTDPTSGASPMGHVMSISTGTRMMNTSEIDPIIPQHIFLQVPPSTSMSATNPNQRSASLSNPHLFRLSMSAEHQTASDSTPMMHTPSPFLSMSREQGRRHRAVSLTIQSSHQEGSSTYLSPLAQAVILWNKEVRGKDSSEKHGKPDYKVALDGRPKTSESAKSASLPAVIGDEEQQAPSAVNARRTSVQAIAFMASAVASKVMGASSSLDQKEDVVRCGEVDLYTKFFDETSISDSLLPIATQSIAPNVTTAAETKRAKKIHQTRRPRLPKPIDSMADKVPTAETEIAAHDAEKSQFVSQMIAKRRGKPLEKVASANVNASIAAEGAQQHSATFVEEDCGEEDSHPTDERGISKAVHRVRSTTHSKKSRTSRKSGGNYNVEDPEAAFSLSSVLVRSHTVANSLGEELGDERRSFPAPDDFLSLRGEVDGLDGEEDCISPLVPAVHIGAARGIQLSIPNNQSPLSPSMPSSVPPLISALAKKEAPAESKIAPKESLRLTPKASTTEGPDVRPQHALKRKATTIWKPSSNILKQSDENNRKANGDLTTQQQQQQRRGAAGTSAAAAAQGFNTQVGGSNPMQSTSGSTSASEGAGSVLASTNIMEVFAPMVTVFQGMYVWATSIEFPNIYDEYFSGIFSVFSVDFDVIFPSLPSLIAPLLQVLIGLSVLSAVVYLMLEDDRSFESALARYVWRRDWIEGAGEDEEDGEDVVDGDEADDEFEELELFTESSDDDESDVRHDQLAATMTQQLPNTTYQPAASNLRRTSSSHKPLSSSVNNGHRRGSTSTKADLAASDLAKETASSVRVASRTRTADSHASSILRSGSEKNGTVDEHHHPADGDWTGHSHSLLSTLPPSFVGVTANDPQHAHPLLTSQSTLHTSNAFPSVIPASQSSTSSVNHRPSASVTAPVVNNYPTSTSTNRKVKIISRPTTAPEPAEPGYDNSGSDGDDSDKTSQYQLPSWSSPNTHCVALDEMNGTPKRIATHVSNGGKATTAAANNGNFHFKPFGARAARNMSSVTLISPRTASYDKNEEEGFPPTSEWTTHSTPFYYGLAAPVSPALDSVEKEARLLSVLEDGHTAFGFDTELHMLPITEARKLDLFTGALKLLDTTNAMNAKDYDVTEVFLEEDGGRRMSKLPSDGPKESTINYLEASEVTVECANNINGKVQYIVTRVGAQRRRHLSDYTKRSSMKRRAGSKGPGMLPGIVDDQQLVGVATGTDRRRTRRKSRKAASPSTSSSSESEAEGAMAKAFKGQKAKLKVAPVLIPSPTSAKPIGLNTNQGLNSPRNLMSNSVNRPAATVPMLKLPTTPQPTAKDIHPNLWQPIQVAGIRCPHHPDTRLTMLLQTDIWPFTNRPSCCMYTQQHQHKNELAKAPKALDGDEDDLEDTATQQHYHHNLTRCGADRGRIYSCGTTFIDEETGEPHVCTFALCKDHFRPSIVDLLLTFPFGALRRVKLNGLLWLICLVAFAAADAAYTPFMKTALMIVGCHPYYQCEFENCWSSGTVDQKFTLAVFLSITTIVFLGIGFPAAVYLILRRRKGIVEDVFLSEAYQGMYRDPQTLRLAGREWSRFVSTDTSALANRYRELAVRWIYFPSIAILLKVATLAPAIFLETRSFNLRLGCALMELAIATFLFSIKAYLSPVMLITLRLARVHQLIVLGLQNIDLVLQLDTGVSIGAWMVVVTVLYVLVSIAIFIATVVWPVFDNRFRTRMLTRLLNKHQMDYSAAITLFLDPQQRLPLSQDELREIREVEIQRETEDHRIRTIEITKIQQDREETAKIVAEAARLHNAQVEAATKREIASLETFQSNMLRDLLEEYERGMRDLVLDEECERDDIQMTEKAQEEGRAAAAAKREQDELIAMRELYLQEMIEEQHYILAEEDAERRSLLSHEGHLRATVLFEQSQLFTQTIRSSRLSFTASAASLSRPTSALSGGLHKIQDLADRLMAGSTNDASVGDGYFAEFAARGGESGVAENDQIFEDSAGEVVVMPPVGAGFDDDITPRSLPLPQNASNSTEASLGFADSSPSSFSIRRPPQVEDSPQIDMAGVTPLYQSHFVRHPRGGPTDLNL